MELKYNELRIGNLFDQMDDGILLIEEIKKDSDGFKGYYAVFRNGSIKCHVSYLQPIPLTEEWLLRFGFSCANRISMVFKLYHNEENSDNSLLTLKEVGNNPTWVYSANNRWTINPFTIEIKYVHQLQNVWHVHTNNELKLIK